MASINSIDSGQLRKRIAIEQYVSAGSDTAGEDIEQWIEIACVWCSIETRAGKWLNLQNAVTVADEVTHIVTIRYFPGLKVGNFRFRYGGAATPTWETMTSDQWAMLTSSQWEQLTSGGNSSAPRYFDITAVINVDERNYKMIVPVVEYAG